ncbi:MAG: UDP-N-acetylmuramoyl-tripeptide--D-alanyl-D-alanine ligase [Chitinophagaceae bacterium]
MIPYIYSQFLEYKNIQTDTRRLQRNDIFFCLKGHNFDGNVFIKEALYKGASLVISDTKNPSLLQDHKVLYVEDCLNTLQQLAKYHRQKLNIPIIAITGSNGKTTTKELIAKILEKKFCILATEGNLNNHIGIPLTLLKLNLTHEIAIIEMGANHIGEIANYCSFVLPNYGLITNIGKAHLEGFENIENIGKAKTELYKYITKHKGTIFVNNEDTYLKKDTSTATTKFTYGLTSSTLTGQYISLNPFLQIKITTSSKTEIIDTQLIGHYNIMNVLAACAVGIYFNIPLSQCKEAIKDYIPKNQRSQIIHKNTNTIILDAYNANPSSMKVAIEHFMQYPHGEKILMLGQMNELGKYSKEEHQKILTLIQQYSWKKVYLVGNEFGSISNTFLHFENVNNLIEYLKKEFYLHTAFLLKGSRSTTMECIIDYL